MTTMNTPDAILSPPPSSYVFVLKVTDQPGAMETIAATFAHRGVSISSSVGNDSALDPEGHATVLVTFAAPSAKKEIIRRALSRLPRVLALVEHPIDSPALRKTAVVRLSGDGDFAGGTARVEKLAHDPASGETTYLIVDMPATVDATINQVNASGRLRGVATAVIGL